MDVKQEPFDPNTEIIKMEPEIISDQMDGNDSYSCSTQYKTIKHDQDWVLGDTNNICEYQTTREFVNCNEIKQECEVPKIEGSDFVENIEYESVRDNVNNFPKSIKEEPENADEVKAAIIGDIKPEINEISEYVQFKIEDELLTSHCDLPTLKSEIELADYSNYFAQPCSSKQTIIKTKQTVRNVPKQKKRGYPWSVLQKIFRSSRKNLFNVQFGRCCEICNYCGQFFLTKSQFMFHFIFFHYAKKVTKSCKQNFGHHKHCQCKNCSRTIFGYPPTANVIFHSNKKQLLQCQICSKTFSTKNKLNNHLKMHGDKNNLKTHLLKIRSEEKQLACEICSKRFSWKCDLKRHLIIHTGEKPVACEICSKRFSRKSTLKMHLIIHTKDKPFACEICSNRFTRKGDLKRHLIIHNEEKQFACEICSKQYLRMSDLKEHLIFHMRENPFTCEICSKWFTRKGDLNRHLIIHTGNKPFACEICSKRFTQKSGLKLHSKNHTGEKPFLCEICSKGFTRKNNLKRHLIIHSEEKP